MLFGLKMCFLHMGIIIQQYRLWEGGKYNQKGHDLPFLISLRSLLQFCLKMLCGLLQKVQQ